MCMLGVKIPVASANTVLGNWLGKSKYFPVLGPVVRACMASPPAAIFGVTWGLQACAEGCGFKAENPDLTLPALGN